MSSEKEIDSHSCGGPGTLGQEYEPTRVALQTVEAEAPAPATTQPAVAAAPEGESKSIGTGGSLPQEAATTTEPHSSGEVPSPQEAALAPATDDTVAAQHEEPKLQQPSAQPKPPTQRAAPVEFRLRRILYFERTVDVLLQDFNGPCPLLALCNILALRGKVELSNLVSPPGSRYVTQGALTNALATYIMERLEQQRSLGNSATRQHTFTDALDALPLFVAGMDVNVQFSQVDDYEATREIAVLDAAGVRLVHGWLVDEAEKEVLAELVKGGEGATASNNDAAEKQQVKTASNTTTAGVTSYNAMIVQVMEGKAPAFGAWLDQNATQLTFAGLFALHASVEEGELLMLFRNNHYATLTKRKGKLYTLITDYGMAATSKTAVWESLEDVDGSASRIVDTYFGESPPRPSPSSSESGAAHHQPHPTHGLVQAIPIHSSSTGGQNYAPAAHPQERKQRTPPPRPGQPAAGPPSGHPQRAQANKGERPLKKKKKEDSCAVS